MWRCWGCIFVFEACLHRRKVAWQRVSYLGRFVGYFKLAAVCFCSTFHVIISVVISTRRAFGTGVDITDQ